MANQRNPKKKLVGFFATEEEKDLLKRAAELAGFDNLADYLRWVARTNPSPADVSTGKPELSPVLKLSPKKIDNKIDAE